MAKEMRLIDADALKERIRQEPTDGMYTAEILEAIDEVPTVDAVEVVYCDECYMHDNCSVEMAFLFARVKKPFCCAGKKAER